MSSSPLNGSTVPCSKLLVEQHFEEAAPFWQEIYNERTVFGLIHQKRRELVVSFAERLGLPKKAKALDIGCGAGAISVGLGKLGFSVRAIDPGPKMIEITRGAAAAAELPNLVAHTGDIEHLAFGAESFDLALAIGVLPWLASYETALREVQRILKPGGFFIANIDNRLALHRLLDPGMNFLLEPVKKAIFRILTCFGVRRNRERVPSTTILPKRFESMLKRSGLEPQSRVMYGFGPITFLGLPVLPRCVGVALHEKAQEMCERNAPVIRALGAQYLVVSRKVT